MFILQHNNTNTQNNVRMLLLIFYKKAIDLMEDGGITALKATKEKPRRYKSTHSRDTSCHIQKKNIHTHTHAFDMLFNLKIDEILPNIY